ncbi:MAG: DUF190 domain-containing protein [Planctomycetota bacterium]
MESVKRLEIVIESVYLRTIVAAMKDAGATGYTVMHDITGTGDRGERRGDGLTDLSRNVIIIAAVPHETADAVLDAVQTVMKDTGGICLVSDAQWLRH